MMETQNKTQAAISKRIAAPIFDWRKLILDIWAIRKKLYGAAVVGAVVGLIIAFSLPKQYLVSVTLAPEMGSSRSGGGLASLASSFLGGGMMSSGPDALNALKAPQIVSSTPFLLEMLDAKVVNEKNGADITLGAYLESEKRPWWEHVMSLPGTILGGIRSLFAEKEEPQDRQVVHGPLRLSKSDNAKVACLRNKITTSVDKKTGIISLSVSLQNPVITAVVADSVIAKLQKEIVKYKISKAEEDYSYWLKIYQENKELYYIAQQKYAQYTDSNSNVILQSVLVESERLRNEMSLAYQMYTQVSQQLQMAQAKMQESKPAFIVIEPPVVPLAPIGIGKLSVLILSVILVMAVFATWELKGKSLLYSTFNF